jgi:hypothetical protein
VRGTEAVLQAFAATNVSGAGRELPAVSAGDVAMTEACCIIEHSHDVVSMGAGGAGLRAALGMAASLAKVADRATKFDALSRMHADQS